LAFNFIKNLLDDNARDLKKYQAVVNKINALGQQMSKLSNEELVAYTPRFKERLAAGETLSDILPEAFAVCREASGRVLGMRHFDVQLLGGLALHDGRIAEMKTGEGKTLVATLPVYLNALTGEGVHVVTVNDYLARRDSEWMGRLYKFLGLSVGLVVHGIEPEVKRRQYLCDITYGTNNEFGFDYLRDNMVVRTEHLVQRQLAYAIVDEVDSILIDEARTPLIISGASNKPTERYYQMAKVIPRLKVEEDYTVDEKERAVSLTEAGVARVEQMIGVENLYDNSNMEINHHVQQALRARVLFHRDRDYVVKDGQVIIVDEFTGRLMFGRRYSEGLHQAIEAKEGVKIERESQTLATITFQNYFRMYKKLSGMTGTAATEEEEFRKIYNLDVVVIPTNKPMIRKDEPDMVFRSEAGKFNAVVEEIAARHTKGQPVLVGTVSIEKSELLSKMLQKKGVQHQVLNAKFHEMEAKIVAQAGSFGSVTIATNMAGRGTDIILGGNAEFMLQEKLSGLTEEEAAGIDHNAELASLKKQVDEQHRRVVEVGGLCIIGTERHESRRIDNQLRGRSGRQGDPGSSRFYISMEDDLIRLFGGDHLAGMMDRLGMDDSMAIDSALVSRSIENAQKKVESHNFDIRKNVLEYDDVMNVHREVIYSQRLQVLREENLREQVMAMIEDVAENIVSRYSAHSQHPEEWDLPAFIQDATLLLPEPLNQEHLKSLTAKEITEELIDSAKSYYAAREERLGEERCRALERAVILRVVDERWMDHIDAMDQLRHGIGLRAYGQRDPLVEYKNEAYEMFNDMIGDIKSSVCRILQRVEFAEQPKEKPAAELHYSGGDEPSTKRTINKTVRHQGKTIGRNDPCPCGSGKKYKKCCGRNLDGADNDKE